MLLFDVFLALLNSPTYSFKDQYLTQDELKFAQKRLIPDCRSLQNSQQVTLYKQFLEHTQSMMARKKAEQVSWLEIILSYYVDTQNHGLDHKALCDRLIGLFNIHLTEQPADGLVCMAHVFLHHPVAFVAFLHYLKQHGVTALQILASHTLQDFFKYHFFTLDSHESAINLCYQLLEQYKDTRDLVSHARSTRCSKDEAREFDEFESYALDGSTQTNLKEVKKSILPPKFHGSASNLNTLHALFGVHYLKAILEQPIFDNQTMGIFIENQFNQQDVIAFELADLLNQLMSSPTLQQRLAQLLTDNTLARCVAKPMVSIFSLIPYHTSLVSMIQKHDLQKYLRDIYALHHNNEVLIPNLITLFNHVKANNQIAARTIFEAILESIFIDPDVLDDRYLLKYLRKYTHTTEIVLQKVRELEDTLNQVCRTQAKGAISDLDIVTIEDIWANVAKKILLLSSIVHVKSTCPNDIYALYRQLAQLCFNEHPLSFDIEPFVTQLNIQHDSVRRRVLLELLTVLDDKHIREALIAQLDAHSDPFWQSARDKNNNFCLYRYAAHRGNMGLIQWLEGINVKPSVSVNTLAIEAAQQEQWNIVRHFMKRQLTHSTLALLLEYAVLHNESTMIQHFGAFKNELSLSIINKAFKKSCAQKNGAMVRAFLNHLSPEDNSIAAAFKEAIVHKEFAIALVLATQGGKKLCEAKYNVLLTAARLNQCDVLNALMEFDLSAHPKHWVEKAIGWAKRASHAEAELILKQFLIRLEVSASKKRQFIDADDTLPSPVKKQSTELRYHQTYRSHGFFKSDSDLTSLVTPRLIRQTSC